jgi:hydrogenase maturation protein HypF
MDELVRLLIEVDGCVQGVGFRPFVYRLAQLYGLAGSVRNRIDGVTVEIEGSKSKTEQFLLSLRTESLVGSSVQALRTSQTRPLGQEGFHIAASIGGDLATRFIPVDRAPCEECLLELSNPTDRRFRYPFISCSSCGPRFTIMRETPFDRDKTSLNLFPLCYQCRAEYDDPNNRRFHAQTIGCHSCGPKIWISSPEGDTIADGNEAIEAAAEALCAGRCVAIKGIGGFHLLCDARCDSAVELLRVRKNRGNKPFAVLYPSLDRIVYDCIVSPEEEALLTDARAPVVLLEARRPNFLSLHVSSSSRYIGAMLASSPLHRLLLDRISFPIVATSGNRSGNPVCAENREALLQLRGVADLFLLHNRIIENPCDDSIIQLVEGTRIVRRLGRGYSPLVIQAKGMSESPILGVGGLLKSTVSYGQAGEIIVGPYQGALDSPEVAVRRERFIQLISPRFRTEPSRLSFDLHPDVQAHFSDASPYYPIQHHRAHSWSLIAEKRVPLPVSAVVFDGSGYSPDGTVWGGEWFNISQKKEERRFYLKPFFLIGGDTAVQYPERIAAALWYQMLGDDAYKTRIWQRLHESDLLWKLITSGTHCILTSSMGRLFDGVSSALELCHRNTFEGEAAIMLENESLDGSGEPYPIDVGDFGAIDLVPMIRAVDSDLSGGVSRANIAHRFHQTVIQLIVKCAQSIGNERVLLTGGCFQNTVLLSGAIRKLREGGFLPYWNNCIPCNDEGLSVGQVMVASSISQQFSFD